jgi:hypothetical protein
MGKRQVQLNFLKTYRRQWLASLCVVLLLCTSAQAQWLEPHRIQFGVSGGFGGVHAWGKPSFDVHWNRLTARVAPGLHYMSGGLTYKLAYFNPKVRHDRVVILSAYYMNDWILNNRRATEFRRDQSIWMLMPGIHVNLNHLGTVYFQVSGGMMYMHERTLSQDREVLSKRDHFAPMGEVRLGGIFLSRKEHVQQFPFYYKKLPAKRIKKKKLKFKS